MTHWCGAIISETGTKKEIREILHPFAEEQYENDEVVNNPNGKYDYYMVGHEKWRGLLKKDGTYSYTAQIKDIVIDEKLITYSLVDINGWQDRDETTVEKWHEYFLNYIKNIDPNKYISIADFHM